MCFIMQNSHCLKEFHGLQTRGTKGDLLMICKDWLKDGKKNAFTTGCKTFLRSALVCHMQQVGQICGSQDPD